LADEIYQNLDWPWMLDDNPESGLLSMGWDPEKKFKGYIKWDMFAEDLMMYLLAIGSPTHPLPEKSWDSFRRPVKEYGGQTYLYHEGESMFVIPIPMRGWIFGINMTLMPITGRIP